MCMICDNEDLTNSHTLDCSKCPFLTLIPIIPGLHELYCSECPMLTEISIIPGLKKLECCWCPLLTEIPKIDGLKSLICYYCKWLRVENENFDDQLKKVIVLQRWFKKVLLSKNMVKLIPQLMPLYYHPESKGGYLHKRNMLRFFET